MPEPLKIAISRIWTESWTSFQKLNASSSVYGDLSIHVGPILLPGVHIDVEGGAELNKAARELFRFRELPTVDSYSMEFSVMPEVDYTIERNGDVLLFNPERGRRVGNKRQLEVSHSQALTEVALFRAKLRDLVLASCERNVASNWWSQNLYDNLEDP